ncbi:hypothetical protein CMEL01_13839 [Colletotrichum melonis]|uniref:F-box domain-containing protein n=1 Tax=Colletotrichum melonis TaxID=1209925 RepID=A0AAI9XTS5_9PEZI|nr:hypothetical protein CMEL01_13839 [Colletotrichum melonis]
MGVFSPDSLPSEILHDILKHLSKRDLCSLRLVSRTYAAFGLPHILKLIASELQESPKKPFEPPSYIHRLTKSCLHDMLESVVKLGVPTDEFNAQGEAALHVAARHGCGSDCIRILLAESANPDVESRLGWTPLMIATRYGHVEAIAELIRGGARLDRRGFHGWTALHVAGQNGWEDIFELLVRAGASLRIADNDGLKATDTPVGRYPPDIENHMNATLTQSDNQHLNSASPAMDASNKPTITFYDIILDPKAYPMAPNPWKTRFALNFAQVPYRTTWVPLNAVAETRNSLQLPANRRHDDGTDFPTLPIIRDPLASSSSSGEKKEILVGDSFDIALHLQRTYLTDKKHQLFQDGENGSSTVSLHRIFNAFVDQVFSQYGAPLGGFYMPLDPRTAEADRQSFLDRFPGKKWEDLEIPPGSEVRKKMLADFETNLEAKLGPCFPVGGAGPFMDGRESPVYADFIVGGWLQFMRGCLPEWEPLRNEWSGGKWGRLFDALQEWTGVDGREGVVPARP